MRVVCDSCGATYKIPDDKLRKAVNKATCRKCGHRMMIQKSGAKATGAVKPAPPSSTVIEAIGDGDNPWAEEGPTQIQPSPLLDSSAGRPTAPSAQPPPSIPAPSVPKRDAPAAPRRSPRQKSPQPLGGASHPGDMRAIFFGCLLATVGAVLLAFNFVDTYPVAEIQRLAGVLFCLMGSLMGLFVLFTGEHGQRKASVGLSFGLALTVGITGALFADIASSGNSLIQGERVESKDRVSKKDRSSDNEDEPEKDDADPTEGSEYAESDELKDLMGGDEGIEEDGSELADETVDPEPDTDETTATASARTSSSTSSPAAATASSSSTATPSSTASTSGSTRSSGSATSGSSSRTGSSSGSSTSTRSSSGTSSPSTTSSSSPSSSSSGSTYSSTAATSSPSSSSSSTTTTSSSGTYGSSSSTTASSSSSNPAPGQDIIDIMVKNNQGVKRCYVAYKEREGGFPDETIVLRITLESSGAVKSAYVSNQNYKDTELDYCLSGRTRSIAFPSFSGADASYRVVLSL